MSTFWKFIWIFLAAALVAGCGAAETELPVSTDLPMISTESPGPYPYPYPYPYQQATVPVVESSYPGPVSNPTSAPDPNLLESLVVPIPASGLGVVTGQMLIGGEVGQPYISALFLASTLAPSDPAYPRMISFSHETAPMAVFDRSGNFLFADIEPDIYALLFWSPLGGAPVTNMMTGEYIFVEVKADEVVDLGIIPIK